MANLAQLVNVIAPIVANKDGLFLQTIYHPLRLFGDYLGGLAPSQCVSSASAKSLQTLQDQEMKGHIVSRIWGRSRSSMLSLPDRERTTY